MLLINSYFQHTYALCSSYLILPHIPNENKKNIFQAFTEAKYLHKRKWKVFKSSMSL